MGCFLACFGSSKDAKGRRIQTNRVSPRARDQRRGYNHVKQVVDADERLKPLQQVVLPNDPVQQAGSPDEGKLVSPTTLVSMFQNQAADGFRVHESAQQEVSLEKSNLASPRSLGSRSKEKSPDNSSSGGKKKVSFNSVVKTYEQVANCEALDEMLGREEYIEKEKTEDSAKPSKSNALSDAGSNASSWGSYPRNHRYQNCMESDNEEEELDYEESDMDVDEEDGDMEEEDEYSGGDVLTDSLCSMESTTRIPPGDRISPEVNSHKTKPKATDPKMIHRGTDAYDQSVLNPVENLSQWKALKARGKPSLQPQKENSALDLQEPPVVTDFNQAASFNLKVANLENQAQRMAVDASLSNWLMSPEPVNKSKPSPVAFQNVIPLPTMSQGSYSPRSLDDRPILGALTVEELRLMSRTSPTKSPDDVAIIGSVGSYWSGGESDIVSGSVSSYKGISNATSKYHEDKGVHWHSTPIETRLEKALNQGSAEA